MMWNAVIEKPFVAILGTGGTITSIGAGPLDTVDYSAQGQMLGLRQLIQEVPQVEELAQLVTVDLDPIPSTAVFFPQWKAMVEEIGRFVRDHENLSGIVITHGTATLEETAFFLNLVLHVDVPVVIVGSQRPLSALSSDAGLNLVNAVRVASSPKARNMGVLVVLNDEVHAAREVAKTSTHRLQAFRSSEFGVLGSVDGDTVNFYRRPVRRHAPDTEFDIEQLDALPRVDIVYAYAGTDGTAVRAFLEAGAEGIVSAGFAPGFSGLGQRGPLEQAVKRGVVVVQSTRVGSGIVYPNSINAKSGFLSADNLNPQKARILLALALTVTSDPAAIAQIFATY